MAIRSTLTPGTITLTAKRDGLTPATVQIASQATAIANGLEINLPQTYASLEQATPGLVP